MIHTRLLLPRALAALWALTVLGLAACGGTAPLSCTDHPECGAGYECIASRCHPLGAVACGDDFDCPRDEICDAGRCGGVDCLGPSDCPEAAACVEGFCTEGRACAAEEGCLEGDRCETRVGLCVVPACNCEGDVDCAAPAVCTDCRCG